MLWSGWLVAAVLFVNRPTGSRQLTAMIMGFVVVGLFFSSCLWGIAGWRGLRWRGLTVPAVSVAVLLAGPIIGVTLRHWTLWWDLGRYRDAAEWVERQPLGNEPTSIHLPPEYSDLAYVTWASQGDECGTLIEFWWGGGFPGKHTARVYSSTDSIFERGGCRGHWSRVSPIADQWYEVSD